MYLTSGREEASPLALFFFEELHIVEVVYLHAVLVPARVVGQEVELGDVFRVGPRRRGRQFAPRRSWPGQLANAFAFHVIVCQKM